MASKGMAHPGDLDWQPFPDFKNPLHAQIWKALLKKRDAGGGFGRICNYYGLYLVTVASENSGLEEFPSYFYDPKEHFLFPAFEGNAFSFYKGNRKATPTNAVALVQHILAVDGYDPFVILNSEDIPHTIFAKENPGKSFNEWLLSKGIVITGPILVKMNQRPDLGPYSEYNVFAYRAVGGELLRYEVECRGEYISELRRYLIGEEIGDCQYLY